MTAKLFATPWSADVRAAKSTCCAAGEVNDEVAGGPPPRAFLIDWRVERRVFLRPWAIATAAFYTTGERFYKPERRVTARNYSCDRTT